MRERLIRLGTIAILLALLPGCGSDPQKKNQGFFTSGNREADQRADQRMAHDEQLQGTGSSTGAGGASTKSDEKHPLYDRLGGDSGIKAIVDDFATRALADPRVNWQRKGITRGGLSIHREESMEWQATPVNVKMLKFHLQQFFSLATGGPTTYQGREMKEAHAGLHISNPEFDATIGDLKASLDKLQIADQEQKELLSIVESTREQIVEDR